MQQIAFKLTPIIWENPDYIINGKPCKTVFKTIKQLKAFYRLSDNKEPI